MLQRMLGRDVRLVTAGHAIAATAQRILEPAGLRAADGGEGDYRFLCTGDVESFRELGTRFLQMPLGEVEHVEPLRLTRAGYAPCDERDRFSSGSRPTPRRR